MKCLVMDFGGTFVKHCLMDEESNMTMKGEIPAPLESADQFVDVIETLYNQYKDEIEGIAVSMPGFIDSETGDVPTAGAYLKMYGHNLFQLVRNRGIEVPLSVENDGKSGALAEVWKGALSDCNDGVAVIIGTGLAGGIIKNRRLHKGRQLTAGELSYLVVEPGKYGMMDLMVGKCGMMGLLYKVALAKNADLTKLDNAELISVFAGKDIKDHEQKPAEEMLDPSIKIDGLQVFKWLEEEDPVVTPIYQAFIEGLAMVVHNLGIVFDPERIVVGGGISRQPRLVKDIRTELNRLHAAVAPFPIPRVHVETCQFQSDANLVGAMYNYMIHFKPELAK